MGSAGAHRGDGRVNSSPSRSTLDGRVDRDSFRGVQTYNRGTDGRDQASGTNAWNQNRDGITAQPYVRGGSDGYRSDDRHGGSNNYHQGNSNGNGSWSGDNHGSNYGHGSGYGHQSGYGYGHQSGYGHGSGYDSYQHGQHYYTHGHVSHVEHYHGGYHVWLSGVPLPFFVPFALFQSDHFRIGLNVNMGGYYNPAGYYDYDAGYYGGSYYRGGAASAGVLRGAVESVDERNGTFVIRNDATGNFVTVEMRDRDGADVRPGDYLELSGDWSRGVFVAYDINYLDSARQ